VPDADYYSLANTQRIYNSYDNSILYTDHLIAEVIRVLRAEKDTVSTMWYTSDHGEDLISESCKFAGHGNGTASDYPVPSVFWYSDAYAQTFGPQLAQLRGHTAVKATTENFFESLIDMAGLDFPGHDPSWRPVQRAVAAAYATGTRAVRRRLRHGRSFAEMQSFVAAREVGERLCHDASDQR